MTDQIPSTDTIRKLSNYIEQNTRASETSGITYIDPKSHKQRILLNQNHIIFGRRGAGKSSLIKTLKDNMTVTDGYLYAYVNMEDFKDASFPNVLIHVLNAFKADLSHQLERKTRFYQLSRLWKNRKVISILKNAIDKFEKEIDKPDSYQESVSSKNSESESTSATVTYQILAANASYATGTEIQTQSTLPRDKLEKLRNAIPKLKGTIKNIQDYYPDKSIFLIIDDLYFLKKPDQLLLIDFFHRLTKDTRLFLKVATIRHRSKIYARMHGSYFGTEIGHDVQVIDLDYNLNSLDELKAFMRSLIDECSRQCKISFNLDEVFSSGAFTQLCLASGGVPRDFLTLFVQVSNNYDEKSSRKINKTAINEAAIQNMQGKQLNLRTDSSEEKEILEQHLAYIKKVIISEKKVNMFLVSNSEIERFPQIRQAIKELVDLRMLHLVEPDTSAASSVSGQRYSAYMVDIGLYPSSMMMNFRELDPGVKDRQGIKNEMRSAPKLDLDDYSKYIASQNLKGHLVVTEE